MAKMLDGPVPEGARSVSWPWYHHELGEELTLAARTVLEQYSNIDPEAIESHVYRIVSRPDTPYLARLPDRTCVVARQSLGYLPVALHRRVLVPLLWPIQTPSLPHTGTPTPEAWRNTPRSRVVPCPRSAKVCLRRRSRRQSLRQ